MWVQSHVIYSEHEQTFCVIVTIFFTLALLRLSLRPMGRRELSAGCFFSQASHFICRKSDQPHSRTFQLRSFRRSKRAEKITRKTSKIKRLYDTRMQNVVCWTIAKYLDNCDPWLCSVCVVGMFRFGQTARSCHPRPIRCHLKCVALYGGHWGSRLLLRLDTSRNERIHGNIFATAGEQRNRHHSVATDETIKPWPRPRTLSAFSCPIVTAAST